MVEAATFVSFYMLPFRPSIVGNLMWTLQLYYSHYRYSMDTQVAKDLFPILRRAVNYYTRIQVGFMMLMISRVYSLYSLSQSQRLIDCSP